MEDGDFRRRPPLWTSYFSPEEVCFLTTVHTLASGSSGNALLLSCGESYILLDAGISCRRITAALRELGLELGSLTAILITHTHADHISGLQTLLKRCAAPVFTTERAARELSWRLPGAETRLDALDFGIPQSIGEFAVTAFPTSHDAPGSCGFRLDAAGGAVGVLTDTRLRHRRGCRHSGGRGSGGAGGQPRHRDPPQRALPLLFETADSGRTRPSQQ